MNDVEQVPVAAAGVVGSPGTKPGIPWYMKLYGALCFLQGAATLAVVVFLVVMLFSPQRGSLWAWITAGSNWADASSMTVILSLLQVLVSLAGAVALVVFGVSLVRNHRRYAARYAYALIAVTAVDVVISIMLGGLTAESLLSDLVRLVILVAISVTVDPSLADERRLQRQLRNMELRQGAEEGTLGRDETGRGSISMDFFNLFWTFVVCCVLGLLIETVYHMVVVEPGVYQDRAGMLFGPFSPIYGFGAVLMTIALNRFWRANPVIIFLVSAVIGGAFEFFVSWFMEVAFGITAWDYTGTFLSIDGRTNGMFMAMWGVLGLVWIKALLPLMLKLINLIPWQWRYTVTAVAAALMLLDGVMTLQSLDCWYERVSGVEPSTPVEQFYADHYDDAYMANRFQSMTINPDSAARVQAAEL